MVIHQASYDNRREMEIVYYLLIDINAREAPYKASLRSIDLVKTKIEGWFFGGLLSNCLTVFVYHIFN